MEGFSGGVGEVTDEGIRKAGVEDGEDVGTWARTILQCGREVGGCGKAVLWIWLDGLIGQDRW